MKNDTTCPQENTRSTCATQAPDTPDTCATSNSVTIKPGYESRYDDQAWEVSVKLPGVSREAIQVEIEDEILAVSARRGTSPGEDWKPLGQYPSHRNYRLHLDVGPEVDPSGIKATFQNGLLTLRLPLKEEVKPRRIEVL